MLRLKNRDTRRSEKMKKTIQIAIPLLFLTLFPGLAIADDYYQRNSSPNAADRYRPQPNATRYDYRRHSYDNYLRSHERYKRNPTPQNYRIMQQRKQIWEMREKQHNERN
jgi:hypothetical protein